MKKKLAIISVLLILIGWFAYSFVITMIIGMTKDYEPYTFELVLEDSVMRALYGIPIQDHPEDYGYADVEEVSFVSTIDGLILSGWYINSAPQSSATILIVHGRTSNRLKTMKYLALFKATGLDTLYNFFIPDMRNSGKSEVASTYMGYKFSEDLVGAIDFLQTSKSQDEFIIYGFSMGAMATATMLHRDDLRVQKEKIKKIVFDSPLADVKGNIHRSAKKMSVPDFMFEDAFDKFSQEMNGYGEQMKLGIQLKNIDIPILIIQSNDDKTTPAHLTKAQLEPLSNKSNIQSWFIDGLDHVQLYTSEKYQQEYIDRVAKFLRNS